MKFPTDRGSKSILIFSSGRRILVDYYSDWIEFYLMINQTTAEIINLMQKQFARWGIPRRSSETVERITTPLNSHSSVNERTSNKPNLHLIITESNGKSESALKIVKALLRKTEKST